jgi:hypothetical protein
MTMIQKYEVNDADKLELYEKLLAKEDKDGIEHFDWKASKEDLF